MTVKIRRSIRAYESLSFLVRFLQPIMEKKGSLTNKGGFYYDVFIQSYETA